MHVTDRVGRSVLSRGGPGSGFDRPSANALDGSGASLARTHAKLLSLAVPAPHREPPTGMPEVDRKGIDRASDQTWWAWQRPNLRVGRATLSIPVPTNARKGPSLLQGGYRCRPELCGHIGERRPNAHETPGSSVQACRSEAPDLNPRSHRSFALFLQQCCNRSRLALRWHSRSRASRYSGSNRLDPLLGPSTGVSA